MNTRRAFLAGIGAAAAANSLIGCDRASRVMPDRMLIRGNGPEPDSLDLHRATSTEAQNILRDLYETLTRISATGGVAPAAAARWTRSDDGRTYTFHLRTDLRWSNGDRVEAHDFVAGLQRLVDPATASAYAKVVDAIENASEIVSGRLPPKSLGVEALDDHTLRVVLRASAPYLPALLAHASCGPLHRPSFARYGESFARPANAISNGPFQLVDWVRDSHVQLVRNPRYWNSAKVHLNTVRYVHLADENAELRAYRANELHVTATVPRGQYDWVREHFPKELKVAPVLQTYYYGFNLERPPFAGNLPIRKALSMAIDRERLASSVLRVGELPAYGWVPPGTDNYRSQTFSYATDSMADRTLAAQRLYQEAGFSAERPLKFALRYNSGEVHNKVAIAIASMWKEALGCEVTLQAVELRTLLSDVERRDFEMFRLGWQGDYNDAYSFLQCLQSNFGVNLPRYSSGVYDALLASAASTTSLDERRVLLERAEHQMLEDHPILPIYHYVSKHLTKPSVRGWYSNPSNVVYSADLALQTG